MIETPTSTLYREPGVVERIALLTAAKIRDSADDFCGVVAAASARFAYIQSRSDWLTLMADLHRNSALEEREFYLLFGDGGCG